MLKLENALSSGFVLSVIAAAAYPEARSFAIYTGITGAFLVADGLTELGWNTLNYYRQRGRQRIQIPIHRTIP